jgi:biotin carboxyl carrier protein
LKFEVAIGSRTARIEVNGARFRYQREGGEAIEREFSIAPLTPGSYSVLIDGRSYTVIAAHDVVAPTLTGGAGPSEVVVNGRTFAAEVFDPREMRARKSAGAGEGRQNIVAMMPGKVVRVLAARGDAVEAGQGLIVVEAMKMQNEMKSPKAGRVVEVKAKADATVAAGEVLLVIE